MKLSKIYSNKKNFKSIKFNDGLNIILGKVIKKYDRNKDTHNLGKSTLITIIDFLLLKDISRGKHIFKKSEHIFNDYEFFLEIKLNNDKYATIKRTVSRKSKVSIKLHTDKYQDFTKCTTWDYDDLSLYSKIPDKNPKVILNTLLQFDVLEEYLYRQTVNYFLRTQNDYNYVFQLSKFKGKDIDWKAFLFKLLGFDESIMYEKYNLEKKYKEQKKLVDEISNKFSIDTKKIDKIKGIIEIKRQDKKELEKSIDEFDFYLKERGISKDLVEELEKEIAECNTKEYNLKFDIEQINESLKVDVNFNIEEIEEIFNEINIYFKDQLKKDYNQLIEFNKEITDERMKYLRETLKKKEDQLKVIEKNLLVLNDKRIKMLNYLQEKDSFQKFKNYQSDLIEIEKEIADYYLKIEKINVVENINEQLKELFQEIQSKSKSIYEQLNQGNENYSDIRLQFNQLVKTILNKEGELFTTPNKSGNVEFNAEIGGTSKEKTTSQADGNTYKKILCVCFDLTLLLHYSKDSYFRFVYHDGILESLDDRKKINYLELIEKISIDKDLQIIITLIEDDIPSYGNNKKYEFSEDQVALTLTDEEGDKGRLFEMYF